MALPWVRLDTAFPSNPKVLMLVEDKKWQSVTVYIGGLAYSGMHGTDGFLPLGCLPFLHGTKRNATDLMAVRLWMPCEGGWAINGWDEFQPSMQEQQDRRKRAQDAAYARWGKAGER